MTSLDSPANGLFGLAESLKKLTRHLENGGGDSDMRAHRHSDEGSAPVDILETKKSYTFFLDVPGMSKSDVQVTLEEDEKVLVVKGGGKRKRDEGEEEGCKYLRLERHVPTKFTRKFRLPEDANADAVSAKCENGVLSVVVEKLPPPPEPKLKTVQVKIE